MAETFLTSLFVKEPIGIVRLDEPVRVGVPFPRGRIFTPASLILHDAIGTAVPIQVQPLLYWPDRSIKWALIEFWAMAEPYGRSVYGLLQTGHDTAPVSAIKVYRSANTLTVDTGVATFSIDTCVFRPFDRLIIDGIDITDQAHSGLSLVDAAGEHYEPRIDDITIETSGIVRTTLRICGSLRSGESRSFAIFNARLNFYAQRSFVEIDLMVRNPRLAHHPRGLWDLGDKGSVYIRDLSLLITLAARSATSTSWTPLPTVPPIRHSVRQIEIYQDSSGGENWHSTNHVNRFGTITTTFRGYRVTSHGKVLQEGERCTPSVQIRADGKAVAGTVTEFWQNFPKAITAEGTTLKISLFPLQYRDVHELQGGEQKTHKMFLAFAGVAEKLPDLAWTHARLVPYTAPEWYAGTKAVPYLLPRDQEPESPVLDEINALVGSIVHGEQPFFLRREIVDEYGWRHFGDLYADHEAIGFTGETPRIAHYNNQYDVVYGAIVQYLRSGDVAWFKLFDELARHVIDIDIYHTQEDRAAYNGGMFWHTAHYSDAATATHRTYSRLQAVPGQDHSHGGGPSSSHNYTTGLLYYYLLTGNHAAAEAVRGLSSWVIAMDEGAHGLFSYLDKRPTGLASRSVSRDYHGPGRGSANSLNALLDGWTLTGDRRYLSKAEELIQRCVHPYDDIAARELDDIEHRWSYTMFFQSLGKFLDCKAESNELDFSYHYGRESLLHYAYWMQSHEIPYRQVLHKVQIPTETWPAQDIRKSDVFAHAAKYATGPGRHLLLQKAEQFFAACVHDLASFPTAYLTRPLAILLTNGFLHPFFLRYPEENGPCPVHPYDFGRPKQFRPQLHELHQLRQGLLSIVDILKQAGQFLQHRGRTKRKCEGVTHA